VVMLGLMVQGEGAPHSLPLNGEEKGHGLGIL
jgi:hypothetical protein